MKRLVRNIEIPRSGTRKELRAIYPNYTIYGDSNGYYWPVEQTKTVVVSLTFPTLIETVKKHLNANDVAIPIELEREMNEFACERHPENCAEIDPDSERKVSLWYQAKRFFTAAISAAKDGCVSQEEAERRAAICVNCPENGEQEVVTCAGCWTAKFVKDAAEALSTKHTSLDSQLRTCRKCQCSNLLKVHVKREAMEERQIDWPQNCWMRPEN